MGRRWEWKTRKHFEKLGYYVIRSAGSKGLADLIALRMEVGNLDINEKPTTRIEVCLIQCKAHKGKKPPELSMEQIKLKKLADWLGMGARAIWALKVGKKEDYIYL